MNLYILSDVNLGGLKFYIQTCESVSACDFGNYMLELANESSALYTGKHEYVLLHLVDYQPGNDMLENLVPMLRRYLATSQSTFIFSGGSRKPLHLDGHLNETLRQCSELDAAILELSREYPNLLYLDFGRVQERYGYDRIYDDKYYYLGRIPYSHFGLEKLAAEVDGIINAHRGSCRKILVLDLDNTLWGGIIGEEGYGVQLGNDGIGKSYQDFQDSVKQLAGLGILLAVNSKNNHEDAILGLNNPNGILKPEDFVTIRANWENKSENLKDIASKLGLGLDSMVFIDDNAVERESVRQMLPEVIVPDFPEEPEKLKRWFIEEVANRYFNKTSRTEEDTHKLDQYMARKRRESLSGELSYSAFLKSLNIRLRYYKDDVSHLERYAQMSQKTNQFNLTTRRYSSTEIQQFIESENYTVFACGYSDKFLNEGIIALCIWKHENNQAVLDTFLMSCRTINREVEYQFIEYTLNNLGRDCSVAIGHYLPTDRNAVSKDFLLNAGFTETTTGTFTRSLT